MTAVVMNTIGTDGRAYSAIDLWDDDAPDDLVVADIVWRGECYNDSTFDLGGGAITISGSTSDATHFKQLVCAAGQSVFDDPDHDLFYNESNGVAILTNSYSSGFFLLEEYAQVDGIQFKNPGAFRYAFYESAAGTVISRCVVYGKVQNAQFGTFINCLFYDMNSSGGWIIALTATTATFIGCALVCNTAQVFAGYGSATLEDCYCVGGLGTIYPGDVHIVAFNCFTDLASGGIDGFTYGLPYDTSTFLSVGLGIENFKLVTGSQLIDSGADDPTFLPTDIFGTARPQGVSTDVGPHEFMASTAVVRRALYLNAGRWAQVPDGELSSTNVLVETSTAKIASQFTITGTPLVRVDGKVRQLQAGETLHA